MQIKVYVVDFEFPRWAKRWMVLAAPVLVVGTTVLARADVELPADYQTNDLLTADGLNTRFNALKEGIDAVEEEIHNPVHVNPYTAQEYSLGGSFCGTTASVNGGIGGLPAAKALCMIACGNSSSAHMCTSQEMIRYEATGKGGPPQSVPGWVETGSLSYNAATDKPINGCSGWTLNDSSAFGTRWFNGQVDDAYCASTQPILCCD